MKKVASLVCVSLAMLLFLSVLTGAASAFDPFGQACEETNNAGICKDNQNGSNPFAPGNNGILDQILSVLFMIAGIVALIMIIVGGFQFVTANGDSAKAAKGRNILVFAVAGLVVVMLSAVIVRFIVNRLTG